MKKRGRAQQAIVEQMQRGASLECARRGWRLDGRHISRTLGASLLIRGDICCDEIAYEGQHWICTTYQLTEQGKAAV